MALEVPREVGLPRRLVVASKLGAGHPLEDVLVPVVLLEGVDSMETATPTRRTRVHHAFCLMALIVAALFVPCQQPGENLIS